MRSVLLLIILWDATCVDTMAPSHLSSTSVRAGAAAAQAENLKRYKYSKLDRVYMFVPFGVETMGSWGPAALSLYRDQGYSDFTSSYIEVADADIRKLCTLPPYPANGRYTVLDPEESKLAPGDKVTNYTIKVICDKGYQNSDNEVLTCWNDGFVDGEISECLPYCTRHKNEVLSCGIAEVGTEVRCIAPPSEFISFASRYNPGEKKEEETECGISNNIYTLQVISGGKSAHREELPWHTGIYTKKTRPYMQICGGSLVSKNVVISAAHCFWSEQEQHQLPAAQFAVAAGKLYRPWNEPDDDQAQKSDVSEIMISPYFRGHATNLQDDIALLYLASPFMYTASVRPVCLDFNADNDKEDLTPGSLGKVAGWGLTGADGPASPVLKVVELPVVDLSRCLDQSEPGFRAHITSDKICAGYQNGTAVCKGDSGGGLVFLSARRGRARYSLRGLVSGSPQSEHLCNTLAWASFTHLLTHQRFITETMAAATAMINSTVLVDKNI